MAAIRIDPFWPRITSVTPSGASIAGGATLRIDGSGFTDTTPTATVTLKGVNCSVVDVHNTTVATCTVGPSTIANIGTGDVSLLDTANRDTLLSNAFTYGATWTTYSSVAPTTGPSYGGFTVTVIGMPHLFMSSLNIYCRHIV